MDGPQRRRCSFGVSDRDLQLHHSGTGPVDDLDLLAELLE
jgi:hypothetical protein